MHLSPRRREGALFILGTILGDVGGQSFSVEEQTMIHDDRLAAALLRVAKGILASSVASGGGKQHCSFRQGGPHSHG